MIMRTGLRNLDVLLGPLTSGQVFLLAGRTGMGTTALALNIARNAVQGVAGERVPTGVLACELKPGDYLCRLLAMASGVPAFRIHLRELHRETRTRVEEAGRLIAGSPLYLMDANYLDIEQLRELASTMKERLGVRLLVVDNLQWIRLPHDRHVNEEHDFRIIASGIRDIAAQLQLVVILTCQLGVAVDEEDVRGVPSLRHLPTAGWFSKADIIAFLRRPFFYCDDPESKDETLAILHVMKSSYGVGDVRLRFDQDSCRFRDAEPKVL